jgi:RNA polymerase sigma-70 factor (ECF subfamily)
MKKKAIFPEELNENINVHKGSNPIEQSMTKMNIKEAMQKLPMEQRNVLLLREIQGYSYSEISSMLKIPLGTVKSRINTARENLRKELQMG